MTIQNQPGIAASPGRRHTLALLAVLLLAAVLLFADLGSKSLWIDEYNNIAIARQPSLAAVTQGVLDGFQRQPPGYFWLLHLWLRLAGDGEAAARSLSVLMGLASLALLYLLGRDLLSADAGLLATYVLAISPAFVMYARMARYYLPTVLLGLLSCWLFLRLLHGRAGRVGRLGWLLYAATNTLLMLCSYVAGAIIVCQVVYALLAGRSLRSRIAPWLASLAVTAAIVGAWFIYALPYIAGYPLGAADFAAGAAGYLVKLVYPLYSFAVGETLFPWRLPALLGLLAMATLSLAGLWRLRRQPAALAFVLTGLAASIILVVIATTLFVVDVPFLNIPSRALFAAPFLYLLVAGGVLALRSRLLQLVALAALTVCAAAGLGNYYRNLEFHNPIYAVPLREIVAGVDAELQPGDVIVHEPDAGFSYYYRSEQSRVPLLDNATALPVLQADPPHRVWLITYGRDATRGVTNVALEDWLAQHCRLLEERGYVEQDATYQKVKEALLHRPAYRYKLVVRLYEYGGLARGR